MAKRRHAGRHGASKQGVEAFGPVPAGCRARDTLLEPSPQERLEKIEQCESIEIGHGLERGLVTGLSGGEIGRRLSQVDVDLLGQDRMQVDLFVFVSRPKSLESLAASS